MSARETTITVPPPAQPVNIKTELYVIIGLLIFIIVFLIIFFFIIIIFALIPIQNLTAIVNSIDTKINDTSTKIDTARADIRKLVCFLIPSECS